MKIKLLINTPYGKIGDVVSVHPSRGQDLVSTRQAEAVEEPAESKSLSAPGSGRAKRLELSNKAVGA